METLKERLQRLKKISDLQNILEFYGQLDDHFICDKLKEYEGYECCYLYLDEELSPLYVGKSINFYQRFKQRKKYLKKIIADAYYIALFRSLDIDNDEARLIEYFDPKFNNVRLWRRREEI
jgi:hypothetical protein